MNDPEPQGMETDNTYRLVPDLATDELKVALDIVLKARKFDLKINFYYCDPDSTSRDPDFIRPASVQGSLVADASGANAAVLRGNFAEHDGDGHSSGSRERTTPGTPGNKTVWWQPENNPTTFAYDAANQIVTVVQATAPTTCIYDPEYRLTGIQFPDGTRSTHSYDGNRLCLTTFQAENVLTAFVEDGQ